MITAFELLCRLRRRYDGREWVLLENVRSDTDWNIERRKMMAHRQKVRYADAMAVGLWPSNKFAIHGFEIKRTRADFLNEVRDPSKSEDIKKFCDHWWLVAADDEVIRCGKVPEDWGIILPAGQGLRVRKKAPQLEREAITPGFLASLIGKATHGKW